MSLFLTKEGKRKSPMAVTIFFVDLLFCLVFGGAYALLTEPLHSLLPLGGGMPETVLHCLIIAVIGTAVCCVLFLLAHRAVQLRRPAGHHDHVSGCIDAARGGSPRHDGLCHPSLYAAADSHRQSRSMDDLLQAAQQRWPAPLMVRGEFND